MANRIIAALNDTRFFLLEWLANPQHTGAVAPSSPKLAGAMARWLPSDPESYVLELGPGTGAVTTALFKRGLRQERLVAIEHNPKMADVLRERFPRAHIITGDAWHLDELLAKHSTPITQVGAVFSSLPLMNFPKQKAETLAEKIRSVLRPRGHLVQYSYHIGRVRTRGGARFRMVDSHIVWANLPPARVSVFQK